MGCTPLAPPANMDESVADGKDNDCDGAIDEDVVACVRVDDATGKDTTVDPMVEPFKTIQAAVTWAKGDGARPKNICVSAGTACGVTGTYAAVSLTMENGYSVYGNYESTTWTRCTNSTTVLQLATGTGILFPSAVQTATVLDGFRLDRLAGGTTAAVTVNGAKHAIISNVSIPGVVGTTTVGVSLSNGAEALIWRSNITGGGGSTLSAGVMSVASTPTVRGNCATFDGRGRCSDFCTQGAMAIRGRPQAPGTSAESYGVLLKDSPNAVVESSTLCETTGENVANVRVQGNSPGVVVRGNIMLSGPGVQNSHAAWLEECNNHSPWILDNSMITSGGTTSTSRVSGIRAVGQCHPIIEQNSKIIGGGEGGASSGTGVYCGMNGPGDHSDCVIVDNGKIEGSAGGFPATAVAIDCDRGCAQVVNNLLDARTGVEAVGLRLNQTGAMVDNNRIIGGCGQNASFGVRSDNSWARLQNNRVSGGSCNGIGTTTGKKFVAVRVNVATGQNELDVHSNTLDGGGSAVACDSAAIELAAGAGGPGAPRGIFRNNILRAGLCTGARYGVRELDAGADPRLLEHQDFDPFMTPVLYLNENSNMLTTIGPIDMLSGAKQNISVDPSFVNYPTDVHITATSMCIAKGTMVGAPARDMDGQMRKTTPDIGADER
jgi:hypothetical protein